MERQAAETEEKEFQKEMKRVMTGQLVDPSKMVRLYKRGLTINKFKNFKTVMEWLYSQRSESSRGNKAQSASCNRVGCH